MPSLYELSKVYQDIQSQDITQEEMTEALNAVEGMFEDKADSIAKLMQSIKSDCEVIKAEEQRLCERRKSLENKQESLKKYLYDNMQALGKNNFKTSLFSFGIQNNPHSLKIENEETFRLSCNSVYLIPQPSVIDKKRILAELKEGKEVVGCTLYQGQSLRIK